MISIVMATYNGETYIREQINSILNQTISDFELIICDDCSKDSTVEIIKSYKDKDKRPPPAQGCGSGTIPHHPPGPLWLLPQLHTLGVPWNGEGSAVLRPQPRAVELG